MDSDMSSESLSTVPAAGPNNAAALPATVISTVAEVGEGGAPERERWYHRATFLAGAIASAVGLGNLWRFPYLSYTYGGGVFFIPYLIFLILLGFPVLISELAVGQMFQGGSVESFGRINKRFRGIGWAQCLMSTGIFVYYIVLLGWGLRYLVESLQSPLPWSTPQSQFDLCAEGNESNCGLPGPYQSCILSGSDCSLLEGEAQENCLNLVRPCTADYAISSSDFFYNTVLEYDPNTPASEKMNVVGLGVAVTFVMCCFVYLSIFKGVFLTGIIAVFTLATPFLIVIGFFIYGVTLPGSGVGVTAYIGAWDFSTFSRQPTIWSDAAGQIFFTLSITYGVMPAYASYNAKKQGLFVDSIIISFTNFLISVFCGFAVFSIAGYMATTADLQDGAQNIDINKLGVAGPSLVFITFPIALSTMGQTTDAALSFLFFFAFLTLGLDSAFSLVEAHSTIIYDSRLCQRWKIYRGKALPRWLVTFIVTLVLFLFSLVFCTRNGFELFDTADFYLNQFCSFVIGSSECIVVTWCYGHEQIKRKIGLPALMVFAFGFWGGLFCVAVSLMAGWDVWGMVGIWAALTVIGTYLAFTMVPIEDEEGEQRTWLTRLYLLILGSAEEFRNDVNSVIDAGNWRIPMFYSFAAKFVTPATLIILFSNNFGPNTASTARFGSYGGFSADVQGIGYYFFITIIGIILVGLFFPDVLDFIMPEESKFVYFNDHKRQSVKPSEEMKPIAKVTESV